MPRMWEISMKGNLSVPQYTRIYRNNYKNRTVSKFSITEADVCQCNGDQRCEEGCLNRSLFIECIPGTCPAGDACQNQRLQKRLWAKISLHHFGAKGWGVVCEAPLAPGDLIVEYIGEVCNLAEVESRAQRYEATGMQHTYIMNLNSNEVIDATEEGNFSRFINHSCNPNSECQKWTVRGEQRIAIFATEFISKGQEITYNYNLDWNGGRRVKCECGAINCSGFLGAGSTLWRKTNHHLEPLESDRKRRKLDLSPPPAPPKAPCITKEYPIEARSPLPRRYSLRDPPTGEILHRKSVHPLLTSITDIFPFSELLRDPFLAFNQEYYMAVADIALLSVPHTNECEITKTKKEPLHPPDEFKEL